MSSADRELTSLRNDLDVGSLLAGDGVASINATASRFDHIAGRLDSPLLAPLRVVPVLGRQLSAVADQAEGASAGLSAAADLSDQLRGLVDAGVRTGPERIVALREVASIARAGRPAFEEIELGTDDALVGQLADSRARLDDARRAALESLDRAAEVSDGLAAFFEGPGDYLLLAANNAQMQNGQGMFLSGGLLHVEAGRLELESMRPTTDIPPASPSVALEPDLAARWGWLDPNGDFRHLGLSHRFPVTAQTAADLWVAGGGEPVDGVLAVDPFLLQVILEASGPVPTRYREVSAKEIVRFALHDQYRGYLDEQGRDQAYYGRRDQLGEVAKAAVRNFEKVSSAGSDFLNHLARAAGGRHLLGWSADPAVQAGWEAAGIDGQIGPSSALVSVVNRSGNKLDWFLRTTADLRIERDDSGYAGELRVTVTNPAPEGAEPTYVVGPYEGSGLERGEYLGLLTVNLPAGATDAGFEGVDSLAVAGGDGANRTIAAWVRVRSDGSTEMVARFRLPAAMTTMTIEPSARPFATRWTYGGDRWNDARAHTVDLPAPR
ncbi:MAG: DUF4012 domain-containing protein [Microthrixaceae bacterium]